LKLPKLYAIIDREVLEARDKSVRASALELREAGVRLVQYRDKAGSPQEVLRAAAEISEMFAGVGASLILIDRAVIAVLAGWSGVHVGQGDLSPRDAKAVVLPQPGAKNTHEWGTDVGGLVGVSTHNEEQVIAADASEADYIAIGPVFATATKTGAEAVVGLEGVRRARALTKKPLVAIGGIHQQNARSVLAAGADSVAVISALMVESRSVVDVAREMMASLG
jgi:thiamine-phosphate pyrophosphorylase